MKHFFGVMRPELYSAISGPGFILCISMMLLYFVLGLFGYVSLNPADRPMYDVLFLYLQPLVFGSFTPLLASISMLPHGASFCSDWNSQYIKPAIIRTGSIGYAWSKVASSALSSILAVGIGQALFILLMNQIYPLVSIDGNAYSAMAPRFMGELLQQGKYGTYFIFKVLVVSVSAYFWSVVALTVSAWIPNRFVAYASPLIVYYIHIEVASGLHMPTWLMLNFIQNSQLSWGVASTMIYCLSFFILLTLLAGYLFTHLVRRRLEHG